MIIRINHPDISGNEKTYLTAANVAGATTLTVNSIQGFSVGQYLVLGKIGEEKTEIVRIHTITVPASGTITLNVAVTYAHPINTPVTYIAFNQVDVYSSTTKTGTYTQVSGSPVDIDVDQDFTEFNDSTGTTSYYYKVKFYNSTGTTYSSFSDIVAGTGYTEESLRKIIDKASALTNDREHKVLYEEEKIDIVNDGYEIAINKLEKADPKRFIKKGYVDVKNSYNTGTATTTVGSTTVSGSGTAWDSEWTGKKILFDDEGFPYEISTISHTTEIVLTSSYNGYESLSGVSYKLFQDEYTLYDESAGTAVSDLKKIVKAVDKNGNTVSEYDLNRGEDGYYIKREGSNIKFCLNYIPATSDAEGRWTVWYSYHPATMDSMADEPEFPKGYSGVLVPYLASKIEERKGDLNKAAYYMSEFNTSLNKMTGQGGARTNEKKGFRLERGTYSQVHDDDWGDDNLWGRTTIGS